MRAHWKHTIYQRYMSAHFKQQGKDWAPDTTNNFKGFVQSNAGELLPLGWKRKNKPKKNLPMRVIIWFRSDLRLHDNPIVTWAVE
jgi:hypothetical protein